MASSYFPIHAHSSHSIMDGMGSITDMVNRTAELGQPAYVATEHGNMSSTVQGYIAARKAGIKFFPGCEMYVTMDVHDPDTKGMRWHMGFIALNPNGYKTLALLQTLSYKDDHFYRKPMIDISDFGFLAENGLADDIAVTTGCYSGMVVDGWNTDGERDPLGHARARIRMLKKFFPNLYVELMDHGITWPNGISDRDIALFLHQIALVEGLPVLYGADAHYRDADQQDTHDLMKDICYFGDGEDNHFSGGPYHLQSTEEIEQMWAPDMWAAMEAGHADLLSKHEWAIPPLDKYEFHVPLMEEDPGPVLEAEARAGLLAKMGGQIEQVYEDRLDFELDVIEQMGFSNYFLLVQRHVTQWCREVKIIVNTRGSANGSLVCYALGITNVDPILWKVPFGRFLSLDRMKPPDIDVDVDFRGRSRLVEHLRAVFPTMTQVGTFAKIGMGKDKDGEDNGSVIVQYMAAMARKDKNFDRKIKPEHKDALYDLADTQVYKSMGVNAAGFILPGEDLPIDEWLPLARVISSDTWVTQFSKDDVEALGYVKIDVLGLRALQTLNGTLTRIGREPNDWDWVPMDDPEACKLLRSGRCTGIFQYEGFSSQQGGREMKIKSTKDAILGLALYRPALMNGGQKDLFLHNRKNRRRKAEQIRVHKIFDPVLNDTEGVPLFQEQILDMLRTIGMEFKDYNDLMGAVKASNGFIQGATGTFARIQPIFYDLCEEKGLTDDEADEAWDAVIGFTEYGFNRAHATSYGLMSYRSAYLKAHYPLEYMASLLDVWADEREKVRDYAAHARQLGISIVKADVNDSQISWDIDSTRRNALRRGLVSLPGIKDPTATVIVAEREANGKYTSIQDFIDRTPRRPVTGGNGWKKNGELIGVCKTLYEAGAFRSCHEY